MKTTTGLFSLFLLLFLSQEISAQYGGYGYGNGYYGGNGYGRSQMGGGMPDMQQSSKPKEVTAEETATKIMEELTPALKLDGLQEMAIKNVLIESIKKQGVLGKTESMDQEAKFEEYKSLQESTNKKINDFLSPEQQETYKTYLADKSKGKKTKKKKKD